MLNRQVVLPGRNVPSEEDLREPQWRDGVQPEENSRFKNPSDKLRSCKTLPLHQLQMQDSNNIQKILIHIKKFLLYP